MELIVIALGGNAIAKRNQPLTVDNQYENIDATTKIIAKLAGKYRLVVVHGNGPQVGGLSLCIQGPQVGGLSLCIQGTHFDIQH